MSERKQEQPASLWADKPKPSQDVLKGVVLASSQAPIPSESVKAANEQRDMFRENDLSDLSTYLVR